MRRIVVLGALLASPAAFAADLSVGVGLGFNADFAGKADNAKIGPGPSLFVPVKIGLGEYARVRATLRADSGFGGHDRLTWQQQIDGAPVTWYADAKVAMQADLGATVGLDVDLTHGDGFRPYLGAESGVVLVNTYHTQLGGSGQPTQVLLDASDPKAANSNYVDPYSSKAAVLSDLHVGGNLPLSDALALWFEAGYSVAFVNDGALKKAPEALGAQREAYGYNAARLGVGLSFSL